MASTVLHIKTEVECKVFLFDEEKGIASSEEQFNLEVNNGYQDLLFVSTTENNTCHYSTILIEKEGTEYHIDLCKGDFQQLTIEIIQLMKNVCRGDVEAQAKLGACFIEGRGLINKNLNTGLLLLKRAVVVNNPYAQNAVGFCFQNGLGVPQDYYKAVFWYRKAAEQNNTAAQYHLASCYEWGLGVDKNNGEAFKWMEKAARQGKCRAQIALGRYYEMGIGVEINLAEALKLYGIAAKKGDVNAIDGVERIQKKSQENQQLSTSVSQDDYGNLIIDENNVYYSSNGNKLIRCSNQDIQEYSVREGCKIISDNAFFMEIGGRCCSITSVSLPSSVSHIGNKALFCCAELRHVSMQDGLTYIGDRAFEFCHNLSAISFPQTLIHIGERAFFACSNISDVVIPFGVKEIGKETFGACSNLVSISLPDTITHIEDNVFFNCNRLKEIHIPIGSKSKFELLLPHKYYSLLIEEDRPKIVQQESQESSLHQSFYLFFDTETTGVPKDYNAPASNTINWPRLVQLGWILTDESGNEISSGNEIVKPEGFVIPSDASRVHGITTEVALRDGKPLRQVIQAFLKDSEGARCFVGHNVSFDQRVVGAELYRLGIVDTVSTARSFDTMKAATDYCKIPGTYGYKWPKLIELHRKLFGCEFEDAHDAMADITATRKCFFEMKRRNLI